MDDGPRQQCFTCDVTEDISRALVDGLTERLNKVQLLKNAEALLSRALARYQYGGRISRRRSS